MRVFPDHGALRSGVVGNPDRAFSSACLTLPEYRNRSGNFYPWLTSNRIVFRPEPLFSLQAGPAEIDFGENPSAVVIMALDAVLPRHALSVLAVPARLDSPSTRSGTK